MFKRSLLMLLIASTTAVGALASHLPSDNQERTPTEEQARKRQREQMRSSVQAPEADGADGARLPARRQLSTEERSELRRLIEAQQHRPGFAQPGGRQPQSP